MKTPYTPEQPWYMRRWFTRLLGIVGVFLTLGTSCVSFFIRDDRARRRGDILWKNPTFRSDSTVVFGFVQHDVPGEERVEVRAWSTETGKLLWRTKVSRQGWGSMELAYSQNLLAVVGKETLQLHDARTGRLLWERSEAVLQADMRVGLDHLYQAVEGCGFSPDGTRLYVATMSAILVYDCATGDRVAVLNRRSNANFQPMQVLLDGSLLVSESRTFSKELMNLLVAVDPKTDRPVRRLARGAEYWSLSADKQHLVVLDGDKATIVETRTAKVLFKTKLPHWDTSPHFLPGKLRVYFPNQRLVWNAAEGSVRRAIGGEISVLLEKSPDGQRLVEIEHKAGQGVRYPLGTLHHTPMDKGYAVLEGLTGW